MKLKRAIYLSVGCLGCVLGAVGAVLPLLPSFPFLMLAAWCFAKSSQKLHNWFVHTNLYKKNLESYVQGRGMTLSTKLRIILMVSGLMGIGFVMMHNVPVGRVLLVLVWVFHLLYFSFGVKTLKVE
ncbi:MAG: YbaN family protein [Negativibacillus sp.]